MRTPDRIMLGAFFVAILFMLGITAFAQQTTRHALFYEPLFEATAASELYSTAVAANSNGRSVVDNVGGRILKLTNDFPRAFSLLSTADTLVPYTYPWRESWVQCNNGKNGDADWVIVAANNSYTLTFGKTAKRLLFPVTGLRAGDSIVGMRALGSYAGAATTHTLTVELTSISPTATATVLQTFTYTTTSVDTDIMADTSTTFAEQLYTAGTPLYVCLVGTTSATTPTITVVGVELLIRQR